MRQFVIPVTFMATALLFQGCPKGSQGASGNSEPRSPSRDSHGQFSVSEEGGFVTHTYETGSCTVLAAALDSSVVDIVASAPRLFDLTVNVERVVEVLATIEPSNYSFEAAKFSVCNSAHATPPYDPTALRSKTERIDEAYIQAVTQNILEQSGSSGDVDVSRKDGGAP